jgi:uncharacterized membrane protein YphA (DoxX/SURF4 family)
VWVHAPWAQSFALGFRFFLGGVLLLSGVSKARDISGFRIALRGYDLLPAPLIPSIAFSIPIIEIILGALLVVGLRVDVTGISAGALLTAFTAWLAVALLRGKEIDCGCFSSTAPSRISWSYLARNGILILMAAVAAVALPLLSLDEYVLDRAEPYSYDDLIPTAVVLSIVLSLVLIARSGSWLLKKEIQ